MEQHEFLEGSIYIFEGNKKIIDGNCTGARAVPGDPGEDGGAGQRAVARGAHRGRRGGKQRPDERAALPSIIVLLPSN